MKKLIGKEERLFGRKSWLGAFRFLGGFFLGGDSAYLGGEFF